VGRLFTGQNSRRSTTARRFHLCGPRCKHMAGWHSACSGIPRTFRFCLLHSFRGRLCPKHGVSPAIPRFTLPRFTRAPATYRTAGYSPPSTFPYNHYLVLPGGAFHYPYYVPSFCRAALPTIDITGRVAKRLPPSIWTRRIFYLPTVYTGFRHTVVTAPPRTLPTRAAYGDARRTPFYPYPGSPLLPLAFTALDVRALFIRLATHKPTRYLLLFLHSAYQFYLNSATARLTSTTPSTVTARRLRWFANGTPPCRRAPSTYSRRNAAAFAAHLHLQACYVLDAEQRVQHRAALILANNVRARTPLPLPPAGTAFAWAAARLARHLVAALALLPTAFQL